MRTKVKVGISIGDINGIGPEVVLKTLADKQILDLCIPVVYASQKALDYHRKTNNIPEISISKLNDAEKLKSKSVNIIECVDIVNTSFGVPSRETGKVAFQSLERATKDLKEGLIDVLVTAPINKETIQSENFNFPGHTEYLEAQDAGHQATMLMVNDLVKVGVVTGHIPLSEVKNHLSSEKIFKKILGLRNTLIEDFAIRKPKIAVLGLNPHAGENGTIGKEEMEIITPAIREAKNAGIMAFGPYPADGFFGSGSYKKFDAVLAMYHDQGLGPFKTLSFNNGVNYTAGLSFIRTSPDHGTAYELAGKNEASSSSFRTALYLAIDIYRNRMLYKESNQNPLKPQSKRDITIAE